MKVLNLLSGCKMVETSIGKIMFGAPSDIVKLINFYNYDSPVIVVQPDRNEVEGVHQFGIEFLLYTFLFMNERREDGEKLILLIKNEDQKKLVEEMLRVTLLGSTEEEYKKYGLTEEHYKQLLSEAKELALKSKNGNIVSIKDLIDFRIPQNNNFYKIEKNNNDLIITRHGNNHFSIKDYSLGTEEDININIEGKPQLPIQITYRPQRPYISPAFGILNLGSRSGFDHKQFSTTFLLSINGVMGLIDSGAYVPSELEVFGIKVDSIKFLMLTHAHDDHCNIASIIYSKTRKLDIITSKEIYEALIIKLKAVFSDQSREEIESKLRFIEIKPGLSEPGEKLWLYGSEVRAHRTVHPIPCIGFTIKCWGKKLFFSGDTIGPDAIKKLVEKDVVPIERYKFLRKILTDTNYDCSLIDGGAGIIHGNPNEFKPAPGQYFIHLDPEKLRDTSYAALDAGQLITLKGVKRHPTNVTIKAIQVLQSLGIDIDDSWMIALMNASRMVDSRQWEYTVLEGRKDNRGFFIVIDGSVEVIIKQNCIASFTDGSFFGELAILDKDLPTRKASIRTASNTALLWEIRPEVFRQFIRYYNASEKILSVREKLTHLVQVKALQQIPDIAKTELARDSQKMSFKKGDYLTKEGSDEQDLFVLTKGEVEIRKEDQVVAKIGSNKLVGEMAAFAGGKRTADVIANSDEVNVLKIKDSMYTKLLNEYPGAALFLGKLLKKRKEGLDD